MLPAACSPSSQPKPDNGIWTDTVGLLFTYGILMPAIVTVCVVVAMVVTRGEKQADDELRSRWARKHPPSAS